MAKVPDRLKTALARFRVADEAESAQRLREIEDIRFVDFDEQWPAEIKAERAGGTNTMTGAPAVPARPCLTINKLKVPVEQIGNEARAAKLSVTFAPKGGGATKDDAEAMEDIARAIQVDSRANLARQWAFERAIRAGRGYYRILTEYSTDGDWDQDIVYKRILNQSSVYLDPSATEPDWSDGAWAFIVEDMPVEKFRRLFPKSKLADLDSDSDELRGIGDEAPGWVGLGDDDEFKSVRVAEYFYVEHTTTEIGLFTDAAGGERTLPMEEALPRVEAGELTPALDPTTGKPLVRTIKAPKVMWCKITATDILEEQPWPGRYIPIVPVIASESNANGERRWTGIVRPSMDSCRSYNYMASAEVESVGLAPRAPYVGYYETIAPYLQYWKQANSRNFAMLPVAAVKGPNGETLPMPQRSVVEPAIQAIVIAKRGADEDIKATTGRWDASLGNLGPSERSGKAILALQKQAEQGSSGWLDNLGSMSMVLDAKILRDLIPKVYGRPGRVIAAIGADEERRAVMLNQPFVSKNGAPSPAQPGEPGAKVINLTRGQYAVATSVGRSYTTRREEAVAAMGQLAEAAPQLVPSYADVWVRQMDFPGADQVADRLKKALPPQLQDSDEQQPLPPQVQQQMQQAQQVIDALSKELDAKTDLLEKEQHKLDAELRRAQMDNETKITIAAMDSETKLAIAQQQQRVAQMQQEAEAIRGQIDAQTSELEQLRAFNARQLEQDHERSEADAAREHERAMSEQQAAQQAQQSAQDTAQQGMLAEQQAALTPAPEGGV